MKQFLALVVCVFLFTSCNFTEEITFNEDGSGEFVMSYDLTEVMKVMEEKMGGSKSDEDAKKKQKVDSVMYFKDMLVEKADSIAQLPLEEQNRLKALESVVFKMKMDEEAGILDFGFGSTFTSLEDLPAALEKIDQLKKLNSKDNAQMSRMDDSAVANAAENALEGVEFKYDGKMFSRKITDEMYDSQEDMKNMEAEMADMGEQADMFRNMTYTLKYNFPNKIKSVSNKNAKIQEDGKTVILKLNLIEMLKDPETMELDVELEE